MARSTTEVSNSQLENFFDDLAEILLKKSDHFENFPLLLNFIPVEPTRI